MYLLNIYIKSVLKITEEVVLDPQPTPTLVPGASFSSSPRNFVVQLVLSLGVLTATSLSRLGLDPVLCTTPLFSWSLDSTSAVHLPPCPVFCPSADTAPVQVTSNIHAGKGSGHFLKS